MTRKPVEHVELTLPAPISVNAIWRRSPTGGMYLSTPYKRWKTDAGYSLQAQRPGAVDGPYALTVKVTAKWSGDLDNAIKGTSDLLQEHGVIKNDKLAQRIVIERSASVDGMFVMVVATKSVEA